MHSKDNDNDIEFAGRVLNCREQLDDCEVNEWLAEPEHRKLLDQSALTRRLFEEQDFSGIKRFERERLRAKIVKKRFRILIWWAAAVLVIGIWGGVELWLQRYRPQEEMVENQRPVLDIGPGMPCAELTLASGRKIALRNESLRIDDGDVSGICNDSAGGLNYTLAAINSSQLVEHYNLLTVPIGGFYKMELSDGTKVWLNAASELRYPVKFGQQKREVYLNGEGYFEVAKDTGRPFIVHLKNSEVVVLGTVFNVSAYENEDKIYTTLARGAVSFYSAISGQRVTLSPGKQSVMEVHSGNTLVEEVDPGIYTAWVDGRFVFHDIDLESMMRQLQRWYNFEVFYLSEEVKKYKFRGSVPRDMSIEKVLGMIGETNDVRFRVEKRTIVVSKR